MRKILTMAGMILAITVLATSSIVSSADAMKVSAKDQSTGIKVRCGINNADDLRCDFRSKYGISVVEVDAPDGTFEDFFGNDYWIIYDKFSIEFYL